MKLYDDSLHGVGRLPPIGANAMDRKWCKNNLYMEISTEKKIFPYFKTNYCRSPSAFRSSRVPQLEQTDSVTSTSIYGIGYSTTGTNVG